MVKTSGKDLKRFAAEIRLETLKELKTRGFGHVGGCMSVVEVLSVLYGGVMRVDPANPDWDERDRLVMSKGHAGPALYATLALRGFFDRGLLQTLNRPGTLLPSHCDRLRTPGVDMTTGSLGQGISAAIGIALGQRLKRKDSYVYLILGDGEMDEGQVWEGILSANQFGLDHLIAFVDANKQQLDGFTVDVMSLGDLSEKFRSFGWHVQRVDGHDVTSIERAVYRAQAETGRPSAIILDTVKGKGCDFLEGTLNNHHVSFTDDRIDSAVLAAENELMEAGR